MSSDSAHEFPVEDAVKQILEDPMVKILLNESNLTSIQFQTFLIDHIMSQKGSGMAGHATRTDLRVDKATVSRGSFNRSLGQATTNVIQSIYTVFLLGFVGIFDSPSLEPFIQASNDMRTYMDRLRVSERKIEYDETRAVTILSEELRDAIGKLAGLRRLGNV